MKMVNFSPQKSERAHQTKETMLNQKAETQKPLQKRQNLNQQLKRRKYQEKDKVRNVNNQKLPHHVDYKTLDYFVGASNKMHRHVWGYPKSFTPNNIFYTTSLRMQFILLPYLSANWNFFPVVVNHTSLSWGRVGVFRPVPWCRVVCCRRVLVSYSPRPLCVSWSLWSAV